MRTVCLRWVPRFWLHLNSIAVNYNTVTEVVFFSSNNPPRVAILKGQGPIFEPEFIPSPRRSLSGSTIRSRLHRVRRVGTADQVTVSINRQPAQPRAQRGNLLLRNWESTGPGYKYSGNAADAYVNKFSSHPVSELHDHFSLSSLIAVLISADSGHFWR